MEQAINILNKGINTDIPIEQSANGYHLFALNAIDESDNGDIGVLGNEKSNVLKQIFSNRVILGTCNISSSEFVVFSLVDYTNSEIGIYNADNDEYTIHVNDEKSENKLNFNEDYKINSTFRIRRGCFRTIYFTDGINKPRHYDFDNPEHFKDNGIFNANKFDIQKTFNKIPKFEFTVNNDGGLLSAGQYFIAVRYVDINGSVTNYSNISKGIIIYKDSTKLNYSDIGGSLHFEEDTSFATIHTNKSISIKLSNLDSNYDRYQLAILIADTGNGLINKTVITDEISINNNIFVFTGNNYKQEIELASVIVDSNIVSSAEFVDQLQHKLLLGNIKGNQTKLCKLQKYASKIKSYCITKKVQLNDINDKSNPKNPLHHISAIGYMPGEIYSFGIVYLFEDGTQSPVYHIPGMSVNESIENTYPMSIDNEMDYYYPAKDDYWGSMADGKEIGINTKVRHHRFPTRSELGVNLIDYSKYEDGEQFKSDSKYLIIQYTSPKVDDESSIPEKYISVSYFDGKDRKSIDFEYEYIEDNVNFLTDKTLVFNNDTNISDISIKLKYKKDNTWVYTDDKEELKKNGVVDLSYDIKKISESLSEKYQIKAYTNILGVKFTDIEFPSESEIGKKVVSYYIVRNKREDIDKTIIDSALLTPTVKSEKYISSGLLHPDTEYEPNNKKTEIQKDAFSFIHLENKFANKFIDTFSEIIIDGYYDVKTKKYGMFLKNDILDGTTYTKSNTDKDSTGWALIDYNRNNYLKYNSADKRIILDRDDDIDKIFYLDALGNYEDVNKVYYNLATDNKVGFIVLKSDKLEKGGYDYYKDHKLPYCIFRLNNKNIYSDFMSRPYFKENNNPYSTPEINVFSGDSYISGLNYVNDLYWNAQPAGRQRKSNVWLYITAAAVAIAGIVASIFTAGSSLVLAGGIISALAAGLSLTAVGITKDKMTSVLNEEYEKGLKKTLLDDWVYFYTQHRNVANLHMDKKFYTRKFFNGNLYWIWYDLGDKQGNRRRSLTFRIYNDNESYTEAGSQAEARDEKAAMQNGYSDDAIIWFSDCLSNLYFESSINAELRTELGDAYSAYIKFPTKIQNSNNKYFTFEVQKATGNEDMDLMTTFEREPISDLEKHIQRKLLSFSSEKGKLQYNGVALPDFYSLNKDYQMIQGIKPYYHLPEHYECNSNCIECFPNRIMWSDKSFDEEYEDRYKTFLPNNYKDVIADSGVITNILVMRNDLYIHTEYALFKQPTNYQERINADNTVYIGTGDFASLPELKLLDNPNKYSAGLSHKSASLLTSSGYYFVSDKEGAIYRLTSKLDRLTDLGNSKWALNNIPILNPSNYLTQTNKTTGYVLGEDVVNRRILFTKLSASDKDKLFTISFSLKYNNFISFHSYFPNYYVSLGNRLYTIKNNQLWLHNTGNEYLEFYGKKYPFTIEYAVCKSPIQNDIYDSIRFNTKMYSNAAIIKNTFNSITLYNSYQNSGELSIVSKDIDKLDYLSNQINNDIDNNQITFDYNEGEFSINNFRDMVFDYDTNMWYYNNVISDSDKSVNTNVISFNKEWMDMQPFRDRFLGVILKYYTDEKDSNKLKFNYSLSLTNTTIR